MFSSVAQRETGESQLSEKLRSSVVDNDTGDAQLSLDTPRTQSTYGRARPVT